MKLFLKTTEKSTVLGVFRVDQAEYGIITIEKNSSVFYLRREKNLYWF